MSTRRPKGDTYLVQGGAAEYGYFVEHQDGTEGYLYLKCPGRDPWQAFDPKQPKPNLRKCLWVLDGTRQRWPTLTAAKKALGARALRW